MKHIFITLFLIFAQSGPVHACQEDKAVSVEAPPCHQVETGDKTAQAQSHSGVSQKEDPHKCPVCQAQLCDLDVAFESLNSSIKKTKKYNSSDISCFRNLKLPAFPKLKMHKGRGVGVDPPIHPHWQAFYSVFLI